jgi:predicted small secreted protein
VRQRVLVQRPQNELALEHARVWYNELAFQIVQTGSLALGAGVNTLRVVGKDIQVDRARAVANGGDTTDVLFDSLQNSEQGARWDVRLNLSFTS